jgi:LysM repeat protein
MTTKNERPEESSNFPYIAIVVLVLLIAGMLYAGYENMVDSATDINELKNTPVDPSGREYQPIVQDEATATANTDTTEAASTDPQPQEPIADKQTATEDVAVAEKPAEKTEPKAEEKHNLPSNLGGEEQTHTVQAGETFFGIANRYNLKWSTLKALNPDVSDKDVKSGVTKLNVRVQAMHTVGPGDVLRVVAQKYGITVQQLMTANKKTKNYAARGEVLIIPFPTKK